MHAVTLLHKHISQILGESRYMWIIRLIYYGLVNVDLLIYIKKITYVLERDIMGKN